MNIIFGDAVKVADLTNTYTVLELDQFVKESGETHTAYAVLDGLALSDFATLEAWQQIHQDIIRYYREGEWNYCERALEAIMGKWGGQMDTFYANLLARVLKHKENKITADWDWRLPIRELATA